MININPPNLCLKDLLDFCFASDNRKKSKNVYIPKLRPVIEMFDQMYQDKASENKFHELQAIIIFLKNYIFNEDDLFFLSKLYDYRLRDEKFGKQHYNHILNNVSNFCPYCNHGYVEEVDHFIPQAAYSVLNVNARNLVPICVSCNKEKDDFVGVSEETNLLHPYYDDLNQSQWLFADIIPKQGICNYEVVYKCIPDVNFYNATEVERLKNNFTNMHFFERFNSLAISHSRDVAATLSLISEFETDDLRRDYLLNLTNIKKQVYGENHWLVALYQGFQNYSGSLDDFR